MSFADVGLDEAEKAAIELIMKDIAPAIDEMQTSVLGLMVSMMHAIKEHQGDIDLSPMTMMTAIPVGVLRDAFLQVGIPTKAIMSTFGFVGTDELMMKRMEKKAK